MNATITPASTKQAHCPGCRKTSDFGINAKAWSCKGCGWVKELTKAEAACFQTKPLGPTEAEIDAAWSLLENAGYKVIAPRSKPLHDKRMTPYHSSVTGACSKAGLHIKNWVVNPKDFNSGTGVYYVEKPLPRDCVKRGAMAVANILRALGDKVLSVKVHPGQAGPVTKIEVQFNFPEEVKTSK